MTYDQFTRYKYRLTIMAANNKTASPPRTEITVNRDDLKIMARRYRSHFDIDAAGNLKIDGSILVPA